jgi:hypothetical protein
VPELSLSGWGGVILEGKTRKVRGRARPQKINLQNVAYFSTPGNDIKITTFTTHLTTLLPSKNHVLHAVFCKIHYKNTLLPQIKNIYKNNSIGEINQLVEGVDSVGVVGGSEAGDASAAAV